MQTTLRKHLLTTAAAVLLAAPVFFLNPTTGTINDAQALGGGVGAGVGAGADADAGGGGSADGHSGCPSSDRTLPPHSFCRSATFPADVKARVASARR